MSHLDGALTVALSLIKHNMDTVPWSFKDELKARRPSTFTEDEMAIYLVKVIPEHMDDLVNEIKKKKFETLQKFLKVVEASIRMVYDRFKKNRPRTPSQPKKKRTKDVVHMVDEDVEGDDVDDDEEEGKDEDDSGDEDVREYGETTDEGEDEEEEDQSLKSNPVEKPESSRKRSRKSDMSSPKKRASPRKSNGTRKQEDKSSLELTTDGSNGGLNLSVHVDYTFMNISTGTYIGLDDFLDMYGLHLKMFGHADELDRLLQKGLVICDAENRALHKKDTPVKASQLVTYLESRKAYNDLGTTTIHIDL